VSISDGHKTIAALAGTAVLAVGAFTYFMPRSEAAEQVKAVKAEAQKSNIELRLEIARERLARLNAKAEKSALSADEEDERKFTRELIAKLQAEALK
jgi:hypothetical protein